MAKWWGRGAAAGLSVAGVVGLGLLAAPAGAGAAPELPPVTAEELVASVITADGQAFDGTAELTNALGLPALPGVPQAADGTSSARIWTDGEKSGRVQLPTGDGERTLVSNGSEFWSWNSADRTVQHGTEGAGKPGGAPEADATDPAAAAAEAIAILRPTSEIAVDGTAEVAGRAAYELVLTPAPTERTLLREVRVAVDAEHRMPLRLTVLAAGSETPALQLGFTDITFGQQDPAMFTFTPPPGAQVQELQAELPDRDDAERPDGAEPAVVGDGWDTVLVAAAPDALDAPDADDPRRDGDEPELGALGTPVSGPWGSGTLISTAVANAIVTDDGRIAAGAVPEQVLTEALSK